MSSIQLILGNPVIAAQAEPGERRWGYCQFPLLERLGSGALHISYHSAPDSAKAYGIDSGKRHVVSYDEGKSFQSSNPPSDGGVLLPNGDRVRIKHLPSPQADALELPAPVAEAFNGYSRKGMPVFDADAIPPELSGYPIERLKTGETEWREEIKRVKVPNAGRYVSEGVFPHQMLWRMRLDPKGRLWGIAYPFFFNEKGVGGTQPLFLVSEDMGHTFTYLSTIPYQPNQALDPDWDKRADFTEPDVAFMPDGSVICLMRTENGIHTGRAPMYLSRSTDGGSTWSVPHVFDHLGVWPTLLTLQNGVTLTCYGRPGLYVRATGDPAGLVWDERVAVIPYDFTLPEPHRPYDTCAYAELLALGDSEALLVYSDFNYPNADGVPVKTILARVIKTKKV